MPRFGANEVDNYGGNGGSSFFSMKNDGDVARVRFMYNNMEDVVGYAVHEVEIDGKKKYVNCLREYNEPKSKCPFCDHNVFQRAKLYIPVYDIDEDCVKLWERGKNFFAKMSSICARYANGKTPLVSHIFEIERHGKPNDTGTTYEIFEVGCDDTTLEDLPEIPEVLGSVIIDASFDAMAEYLETGSFPSDNAPVTRRGSQDREQSDSGVARRTPSSRRGDAF